MCWGYTLTQHTQQARVHIVGNAASLYPAKVSCIAPSNHLNKSPDIETPKHHTGVLPYRGLPPCRVGMASSAVSPSLADRLVTACYCGYLPSIKAAIADGASVNEEGTVRHLGLRQLPLVAAMKRKHQLHHDAVVSRWLLSHGADPNGNGVMYSGASDSTTGMLQLLVDAGGDVNRESGGAPPLFTAVHGNRDDSVRVLLAEPSTHLTVTFDGKTPEQYAHERDSAIVADMITQEVSGHVWLRTLRCGVSQVGVDLWRISSGVEASDAGTTRVLFRGIVDDAMNRE